MQQKIFNYIFTTCFGESAVFFHEKPFLIQRVLLPCSSKMDMSEFVKEKGFDKTIPNKKAIIVSKVISAYFEKKQMPIFWPPWQWMDMGGLTNLQKSVLGATANIPYAELRSYKQIAADIGSPLAWRFVGSTLACNPFPILIPCHRVIRSNFTYGKYAGGSDLKKKLIELEADH